MLWLPLRVSNASNDDSYLYIRSGEHVYECGQFVYLHLYYKTSISKGNYCTSGHGVGRVVLICIGLCWCEVGKDLLWPFYNKVLD